MSVTKLTDPAKIAIAKAREKSEIRTRSGSLIYLVFGTSIASAMVGMKLAEHFELNWFFQYAIIVFLVVFSYLSIDSSAQNNLKAASDDGQSSALKNYFQRKSIVSLMATVLFSICASYFVGQFTKGESPYKNYNESVEVFSKRDSTNKALAAATLSQVNREQRSEIKSAKSAAKSAEATLAISFEGKPISESWKRDYLSAKNNPTNWMWTCSACPSKYKRWRNQIQKVRSDKTLRIEELTKTSSGQKNKLINTLASQMESDSTLTTQRNYTEVLAAERENNSMLITLILILFTIFAALSAYSSNNNVKRLRAENGQHIFDGDQLIFDVFEDFLMSLLRQFLGLLFGCLIIIDKGLEKVGIDLYEIKHESIAKFTTNEADQVDQYDDQPPRVVINAFGRNKPDQPETLVHQEFPADQPIPDQLRPASRTTSRPTSDQPTARPVDQPTRPAPTKLVTPADQPTKVIEKETRIIINNTDLQRLKSDLKKYYLRSFFPSQDAGYKGRKNAPAQKTLDDNDRRHLAKKEELKNLGIGFQYVGKGAFRTIEF